MNKAFNVLMVEDSVDDALLLSRQLRQSGLEVNHERVETRQQMSAALDGKSWDIIICDHTIPGFGSLSALQLLKEKDLDIPFIIVSGTIGEEAAVGAMKAGANDYVMKNKLARLIPSIEREFREAEGRRERRKAEAALRQSQQELSDFFEHAPVGMHWESPEGIVIRVNEAGLAMLGYESEDYIGHHSSEFFADPEVAETALKRLHRGETLDNFEARLRCKNGSIRHVLINANALWENGAFIRSRWFVRDITDRKQAEETRAYLAALVESSEDAIIGKTLDGKILTWNRGAEIIYGYQAEEVVGQSISIVIPPYRPEEFPQIYARIKRGEQVERHETVRIRKDGTPVDVSLTLSPIKDNAGKVIGVSAIERDITARKREEEERIKLIEELTAALTNIKTLRGLLPICSSCKKIRDDKGYWQKVESYISAHSEAEFTHGICPECLRLLYPEYRPKK